MPLAPFARRTKRVASRRCVVALLFVLVQQAFFFAFLRKLPRFTCLYSHELAAAPDDSPWSYRRPLSLQIMNDDATTVSPVVQDRTNRSALGRSINDYWIGTGNSSRKIDGPRRGLRASGCVPLGDWQDELHPTCIGFHEIDFDDLRFSASGYSRETWMYREQHGNGTRFAIKMLRALTTDEHTRDYDHYNEEKNRKDAVASAVLSYSPYVANVYGYCSNSAIYDFADGNLWTIRDDKETNEKDELFKFAHDVAMGVNHSQHIDSKGRITLLHGDIKPEQFVKMNGVYKITDFNMCRFLSWNSSRNEYCDVSSKSAKERISYEAQRLGVLYNHMLGGKSPFDDPTTIKKANSTHPLDTYVPMAMELCLTKSNVTRRPLVQEVADWLHAEYLNYSR